MVIPGSTQSIEPLQHNFMEYFLSVDVDRPILPPIQQTEIQHPMYQYLFWKVILIDEIDNLQMC